MKLKEFAIRYALPHWHWYAVGTFFLIATNYVTMRIPQLAKSIVNALREESIESVHVQTALLIIALGVLVIIVRALSRLFIFWPARLLEARAKDDIFSKIMSLPAVFFERFGMGELISRLTNDTGHLRAFFAFGVLQFFNLCFLVGFTIFQMLSVHVLLTVLCLLPLTLMIVLVRFLTGILHKVSIDNQIAVGRLSNRITESLVNVHIIKISGSSETFVQLAEKENESVFKTNMRSVWIRTVFFPLMNFLMLASTVIVFLYGGYEVQNNRLTLGDILAFNIYLGFLSFPITAVGIIVNLWHRCIASLERLNVIRCETSEKALHVVSSQLQAAPKSAAVLRVDNLSFKYPSSDNSNLTQVSFELGENKKIGIAGPIGSGKTTLLQLIAYLYPPPAETIFFRGQDLTQLDPIHYRSKIAYAQQSAFLFSTTIRENLLFGLNPKVDDSEVYEALKKASILDEIMAFDERLDATIGERGLRLSGGQRQRLALARVFLRSSADLFLFDDVLSAVDYGTEESIIAEILKINASFLFVSHRPRILEFCDQILIFKQGRLDDMGTFHEMKDKI